MARRRNKSKKNIAKDRNYPLLREYKGSTFELGSLASLGAHSVGIGQKRVAGKPVEKLCLRFYISKKRPLAQISSSERIPERLRFFSRKKSRSVTITTDVIETPMAQFEAVDPESRVRPVPGGVSCGPPGKSGTLGGWVWDKTDDTIVMLSNVHVFGHVPGVEILQQSTTDGGSSPADRIGVVKRGIPRSDTEINTVDCAIGDPDNSDFLDLNVLEVGPAVFETSVAEINTLVEKYGQTTRHTFGQITDADWSGQVSGRPFDDCLRIAPVAPSNDWSSGGDSGSLVFAQDPTSGDPDVKSALGLHFAGSGTHGFACKIQNVFTRLSLEPLASGAFTAFLDGLFEVETEGQVSEETESRLRALSSAAVRPFVRRERERLRAGHPLFGISEDLRARLATAAGGRKITGFFDAHKAELLTLLAKEGDIRRATAVALRPLLAGAVTTTDVLERVVTEKDLARLDRLGRELSRFSSDRLQKTLKMLSNLKKNAAGQSLAEILGIEI